MNLSPDLFIGAAVGLPIGIFIGCLISCLEIRRVQRILDDAIRRSKEVQP